MEMFPSKIDEYSLIQIGEILLLLIQSKNQKSKNFGRTVTRPMTTNILQQLPEISRKHAS